MAESVKVFVSYSWGVEAETKIVDDLEAQGPQHNILLIRDEKEMQLGDRISKFMERITGATHVVTVLSKNYFESPYCLYELKEVLQHKGLAQKIYPVMADELQLSNLDSRLMLVEFWRQKVAEESPKVANLKPGDAPDLHERLKLYRQFEILVDGLMESAGDILALQNSTQAANQDTNILKLINPVHQIPKSAIFQPPEADNVFMEGIEANLFLALERSNTLRKQIALQLDIQGEFEKSESLAKALINRSNETDLSELLRDHLYIAVDEAISSVANSESNSSAAAVKEVELITSSADTLFAHLLLHSVREEWMAKYQKGCSLAESNLRDMPFAATAMVEIVTARHLQRQPRFKLNGARSDITGAEGCLASPEAGFETDDQVTAILRQLWKQVFPMDNPENLNERRLGSQIKTRHIRKGSKHNYYLVIPNDKNHPLMNMEVRNDLIRRVPQIPLIMINTSVPHDALLVADDEDLVSIILDFYLMLDEYRPYEPKKNN